MLVKKIIKPVFYERLLDWHNTSFNGSTHIFLDLWEDCYIYYLLTCKNIMPHVKILEHINF